MKELRIGIIGQGIIAQEHLNKYADIEGVTVAAVCDIQRDTLDASADARGIKDRYLDYRDLIARDDLDAVDVCLHNNLHAPIACDVMKAGKHCYCEKPMAGSYRDAAAMAEVSRLTGKMLHIQLAMIYSPESRAALKLIRDGRLGSIYHLRSAGYRRRGRPYVDGYATKEFNMKKMAGHGALFDMGVYHISQLLYLTGNPKVLRVSGQVYQELDMDAERRQISGFNVDELGVGFVKFENNLTMDIIESWAIHAGPFGGSAVCGSEGGINLSPFTYYTGHSDMTFTATPDMGGDEYRNHQLHPEMAAFDSSQAHWAAALRGDVQLLPTCQIALNTMLVSEGIFLSGQLGREVTADEIVELSLSNALAEQETPFGTMTYDRYPFHISI
jgi:predicted dehydrogenase